MLKMKRLEKTVINTSVTWWPRNVKVPSRQNRYKAIFYTTLQNLNEDLLNCLFSCSSYLGTPIHVNILIFTVNNHISLIAVEPAGNYMWRSIGNMATVGLCDCPEASWEF